MKAVIFLGPSLPLDEARAILDATYLPPARQTDLMTAAVNHRPDVIGLIDGVFFQSLSVWHKEILFALDQGIHVYGASSMGALRAAETDVFGMVGVGEIYRQYASGRLCDDEEVALGHGSAEISYRKTSEPMVNVRATLAAALCAGVLDEATHDALVSLAKGIYFAERTLPAIVHAAAENGISASILDPLKQFFNANYVDLKRQDAVLLLETIRDRFGSLVEVERARCSVLFRKSTAFETLYNRDRRVEQADVSLPLEAIANYVALHHDDFDQLNFNALNRTVVFAFADLLGLQVPPDVVEAECSRFRARRQLHNDESLSAWLAAHHLSLTELHDLVSQIALCRRLHQWFQMANWMERTTKAVLDELRLTNGYVEWVDRAAAHERLLAHDEHNDHAFQSKATLQELFADHADWTGRSIDIDPKAWCEEAGFHTEGNLKMELTRGIAARRALLELLARCVPAGVESEHAQTPMPIESASTGTRTGAP